MISIKNLNKYFNKNAKNEIHVINQTSLEFATQGMIAIFGKSGCGKTTLLNVIGGLDKQDSGEVLIDNQKITVNNEYIKNKYIGYIFQNYNLLDDQTVFENVANSLYLCGINDHDFIKKRVNNVLKEVGLANYSRRLPSTLSGGQQQRVAIARALVKNPSIILADEPTGNLDEHNTLMVMELLKKISKKRLILLVTHEEDIVSYYCDSIIEIVDGKVTNIKDNKDKKNYDRQDKNDIYLGDFERKDINNDLIDISYFGDKPGTKINLKIVNKNGKIYLQANDNIVFVDQDSEIKFKEGSFKEIVNAKDDEELDEETFSPLPEKEKKNYGRLFKIKSSIISGYRTNFVVRKRRNIFFRILLIIFAIIITFVGASFGTTIHSFMTTKAAINNDYYYVYTGTNERISQLDNALNDPNSGIDYYRLTNNLQNGQLTSSVVIKLDYFNGSGNGINYGGISMTNGYSIDSILVDQSLIKSKNVIAGKANNLENKEIVLTKYVADTFIENCRSSFISQYKDLIGLLSTDKNYVIAGIVSGNENVIYGNELTVASDVLANSFVKPASYYGLSVDDGKIMMYTSNKTTYYLGLSLQINGKMYTIDSFVNGYYGYDDLVYMSDKDFINISKSLGNGNYKYGLQEKSTYNTDTTIDGSKGYYAAIHLSDVNKGTNYINEHFKRVKLEVVNNFYVYNAMDVYSTYSPKDLYNVAIAPVRTSMISALTSIVIMLGIMSLCIYFAMKASLLSKIKEIGIYRALGVSRKNITFRFFIESIVLVALTVLIGFIISVFLINYLGSSSVVFKGNFYLPFWYALVILVFMGGICTLFGTLPIITLSSKTPSEILSKYDI